MTGGTAIILGSIGSNFGAGMTGGMAYLYDPDGEAMSMINPESFVTCPISSAHYEADLKGLIEQHAAETYSRKAQDILQHWASEKANFVQICPIEMLDKLAQPLGVEPQSIPAE